MAILQVEYTEQADLRQPDSAAKVQSLQVDVDPSGTYEEMIQKMAKMVNIVVDDFQYELSGQKLRDLKSVNIMDGADFNDEPIVLVNGQLQIVSKELGATVSRDEPVAWWRKKLSCHAKQRYPRDCSINFTFLLATGEVVDVRASPHERLCDVMNRHSVSSDSVTLSGPSNYAIPLSAECTLLELGVKEATVLSQLLVSPERDLITVYIKTLTGKITEYSIVRSTSIDDMKYKIRDRQGTPLVYQSLMFCGCALEDRTLADYGIVHESTIHLILNLRGGMYIVVSSRDGFQRLGDRFPTMKVQMSPVEGHVSSVELQPSDFVNIQQMESVLNARSTEFSTLLHEKESLEKSL